MAIINTGKVLKNRLYIIKSRIKFKIPRYINIKVLNYLYLKV